MSQLKNPSRRTFLQTGAALGGGLMIGVALPEAIFAQSKVVTSMPNAWIRIGSDNTVTILCARSEMGQGVVMALPTLDDEELEVDLRRIKVDFAPPG
jgi:isoquinoline 1-oxidoreductase beta subunit